MKTPLGLRIRILRISRGIKLKNLADKLGVTPSFVSAVENGKKQASEWMLTGIAIILCLSEPEIKELIFLAKISKNEYIFNRFKKQFAEFSLEEQRRLLYELQDLQNRKNHVRYN